MEDPKNILRSYNILVMDDALHIREQYRSLFAESALAGRYRLIFATNMHEALIAARSNRLDIALLDLRGKEDDEAGFRTARRLRQGWPDLIIVIMTETDIDNIRVATKSISHGFQFVEKPILLSARTSRLYLELLLLKQELPLPRSVTHFLAHKYTETLSFEEGHHNDSNELCDLTDTERQVALWYRDDPNASEMIVAQNIRKNPETLRQAAKRLRAKLRALGFEIDDGHKGRDDVIQALRQLKITGFE